MLIVNLFFCSKSIEQMYIVFFEVLLMNKNVDYVALGKRIKEKRIQSHLTQEQLGEMCDLSTAHIGHIERGTRIPSVDVLFQISQVLNVSIDYLIFDSVSNNNILSNIDSMLKNNEPAKVNQFLNTIKVLADNIDKL